MSLPPRFAFVPTVISILNLRATSSRLVRQPDVYPILRKGRCAAALLRMVSTTREVDARTEKSSVASSKEQLTFQDAVMKLQRYWADRGCVLVNSCNSEVGAGTMNPATFLRALGPEPWNVAYVEPSVRPDDSRYGENPNRVQMHTQFQVLLKPAPQNSQELVLGSYEALGIDVSKHDVRFVEDNWEHPALGAWGLGWEVWLDGMEISQFTYFQQVGGEKLDTVAVEVTYGLERILMSLQNVTHFKDILYSSGVTYGEMYMQNEIEMSSYNMDYADIPTLQNLFDAYEKEASALLKANLPIPGYGYLLKASHVFNILDSRGAVGVTERARFFKRMRSLARQTASLWIQRRDEVGFPLLKASSASPEYPETRRPLIHPNTRSPSTGREEDFVLEVGVEELPPNDVTSLIMQLDDHLRQLFARSALSYEKFEVVGGPRRIVASAKKMLTSQPTEMKRIRGPPERVAFTEQGELSKAGLGFLGSQGGRSREDLVIDGGYVYLTQEVPGRLAFDIIRENVPEILRKVVFPRSMRWEEKGFMFSRPIRWVLAMLADQVVPFEVAGIHSRNCTRGLRGAGGISSEVLVPHASALGEYHGNLQVISDGKSRRRIIELEAKRLAQEVGGMLRTEELRGSLMEELVNLTENPIIIRGSFDSEFLSLPVEVLTTVMKKHQRYFPVMRADSPDADTSEFLLPYFIAVINGNKDLVDLEAIRKGNESVLRARYRDALFFYEKDTEKDLSHFIPSLEGIIFQDKLGNMLDKTDRIDALTKSIAELADLDDQQRELARAGAKLCKADLATSMVKEMTSLAGVMGKHYAELSTNIPSEVANVILESSLPRFAGDKLPASLPAVAVSLADRFDSLVSLFSVGAFPKSTSDPFALRRAALGIVTTLIEAKIDLNVREVARFAGLQVVSQKLGSGNACSEKNISSVTDFVARRMEGWFIENGFRVDVVKAVLAMENLRNNPYLAFCNIRDLQETMKSDMEEVRTAVEVYNRPARFLKGVHSSYEDVEVDPSLFDSDLESALHRAIKSAENDLEADRSVPVVLTKLVGLKSEVDGFFDGVFINSDDEKLKRNRIALCRRITRLLSGVVRLDLLQISR